MNAKLNIQEIISILNLLYILKKKNVFATKNWFYQSLSSGGYKKGR